MSKSNSYALKELSYESMIDDLSNTSPLKMSKKLIEYELYDQKDSIGVLNQIYKEFESKENLIDNLVTPMLLNIADGLVKHPRLKGGFRKTNITPSRLVNEVNNFQYEKNTSKNIDEDLFLTQAEKTYYNNEKLGVDSEGKKYNKGFHRKQYYDTKSRNDTRKDKGLNKIDIEGKDMDHVNPINSIRKKYQNNPYLYREDIAQIISMSENEEYIDPSLNKSKGDKPWDEYISSAPKNDNGDIVDRKGNVLLTKEEQQKKIELQKAATSAQNKVAAKEMGKNIGLKGLGDVIVLLLKPIWFEIKDMFKNGVLHGFDTNDKIKAFLLRLKRVGKFINENVVKTLGDSLKDVIGNFIPMLISSIAKIFTGMFNKIIQVISDGFVAIKESFKILMKPDSEISPAQKADAIMKVIASAIVPILIFSFEETILTGLKFLDTTPFGFLKDVAMILLSGLATTLVVWLLDQIDIFSVKDEKRLARVKEIFELRIETIKKNTDIFEQASMEVLTKQKLQFRRIVENLNQSIKNNRSVNDEVYQMADFMRIDLKIKSTDQFLQFLSTNEKITI